MRRAAAPPLAPGACRGCNVLLITIDTLRLDRVGAFGGRPGLTPNLDRLASEGIRFTHAYSAAPLTLPSHASILTAVSPPVHGLRANGLFRLGPQLPTLATVLKGAGYRTGAFVGAFVLDARFGLNRGFDVYDDRYGEKASRRSGGRRRTTSRRRHPAGGRLDPRRARSSGARSSEAASPQPAAPSPWFAWVHLYDPHEPYRAPEPYASQHEPYDAEVAYTDAMVGKLLADLRAAGQLDRTLSSSPPITARASASTASARTASSSTTRRCGCRGSSRVREFGVRGSGRLRIRWPRAVDRPRADRARSDRRRRAAGIRGPFRRSGGGQGGRREAPAYLEAMDANLTRNWAPLTAVATRDYKLIDLPNAELYDSAIADPHETVEPVRARRRAGAHARGAAARHDRVVRRRAAPPPKRRRSARMRGSGCRRSATSRRAPTRALACYTDADDPKTLIAASNDLRPRGQGIQRGLARRGDGRRARHHPRPSRRSRRRRASSPRCSASPAICRGAIATLEDMVRRGIADQRVMIVLADYLASAGALPKALALLEAVVAAHPDDADALQFAGGGGDADGTPRSGARRRSGRCSSSIRRRRSPTPISAPTRSPPVTWRRRSAT